MREKAVFHDNTNGGVLTNREIERMLHSALERSGQLDRKVSMIFSDTCLNGMVEVMHELAKYAEVIVGSEDLEPGDGWDYKRWFEKMAAKPPSSSAEWAKQAVDAFEEAYKDRPDSHPCTLAAFKTDNTIVQMFRELIDTVDADGQKGFHWMVLARTYTQSFDVYASYDLLHFTQNLKEQAESDAVKKKADDIVAALQVCRVHSVAIGESVPDAQGLSFWFPQDKSVYRKDAETYRTLSFDAETGWTNYLKKYYQL